MPYWLQLTIFAVIAGLMQYIVSYFKEKGKNLATKEDIKEITNTVESIKTEISVQKQRETEYLYKRNESLIEFLNCLDELDIYRMKVFRMSNTLQAPDISYQYLCDLENYILKLSKQYRLLIVYNPNKKSEDLLLNIYNASNDFSNLLYSTIFRFYNENVSFTNLVNCAQKGNQDTKTEIEKSKERAIKIIEEYNRDSTELYKKYIEAVRKYNIYLKLFFDAKLHLKTDFPTKQ
jgi:molecular chaperone DnaK (HSP70)